MRRRLLRLRRGPFGVGFFYAGGLNGDLQPVHEFLEQLVDDDNVGPRDAPSVVHYSPALIEHAFRRPSLLQNC